MPTENGKIGTLYGVSQEKRKGERCGETDAKAVIQNDNRR